MPLGLVVVAWICVLVAFAVAFHADNLWRTRRRWTSRVTVIVAGMVGALDSGQGA
ncbi:hypothetical protein ABZ484_14375 [Streptomyces sp. NPDC006393]|uniref:hypothetical protein n=1 Tax=Streptomyces sp. NPDC006393 TaxID=3156763 RepID=UPI003403C0F7